MFSKITIRNCYSFVDVEAPLSPFTLVIGANGTGKSNFLKVISAGGQRRYGEIPKHWAHSSSEVRIEVHYLDDTPTFVFDNGEVNGVVSDPRDIFRYTLEPAEVGKSAIVAGNLSISETGKHAVSVLDELKNGDNEELFDEIENSLKKFIPSIEKLSAKLEKPGTKSLQVREKGIPQPVPVSKLSEGTKLLLLILTIVHQERAPKVILLEDLDRGLHPRLFQQVVQMLREIAEEKEIQIIATTHNPYLVDEFHDNEEAVLIVEKENGESTITTLEERLEKGEATEGALGSLWFGGFVGGVPKIGR